MEKRTTRRMFPTGLFSKIGKKMMMMRSQERVKKSRFLYAVFTSSCGICIPPAPGISHRIWPVYHKNSEMKAQDDRGEKSCTKFAAEASHQGFFCRDSWQAMSGLPETCITMPGTGGQERRNALSGEIRTAEFRSRICWRTRVFEA